MPDGQKRVYGSNPIKYCWSKIRPLAFITTWGERGDTLWMSPTYNSGVLERARGRWGISRNGAQNPLNWMARINFKQYTENVYAVTDAAGLEQIDQAEEAILNLEEQLSELHTQLQHAKQQRSQLYKDVCRQYCVPVTSKDLVVMRDHAYNAGTDTVTQFSAQEALDTE